MKTYTFYLHEADGAHVPAFEIEQFDDRNLALAHARRLLADRLRYSRIVVSEEQHDIACVERPARIAERRKATPERSERV